MASGCCGLVTAGWRDGIVPHLNQVRIDCRLVGSDWLRFPACQGKAKFDLPSRINRAPAAKSAVFWLSNNICPSQKTQPLGAKLNGNVSFTATKGGLEQLVFPFKSGR